MLCVACLQSERGILNALSGGTGHQERQSKGIVVWGYCDSLSRLTKAILILTQCVLLLSRTVHCDTPYNKPENNKNNHGGFNYTTACNAPCRNGTYQQMPCDGDQPKICKRE